MLYSFKSTINLKGKNMSSDEVITLKAIREEILRHARTGERKIIYENESGEQIILFGGTLCGNMNNRYFGCWCYMPGNKLFFIETNSLKDNTLQKYPPMKTERVREFLDELDQKLTVADNPFAKAIQIQMHSVREQFEFERKNPAVYHNISEEYRSHRQATIETQRQRELDKRRAEAQAAAERRRQNKAKKEAQKEAKRLSKQQGATTSQETTSTLSVAVPSVKSIQTTNNTPTVMVDKSTHNQTVTPAIKQMSQNTSDFAVDILKADESVRARMFEAFNKHTDLPPVFEYNNYADPCFYLKMNGKAIQIILSDTLPYCQALLQNPTRVKFLTRRDMQNVMSIIDENLNTDGQFDDMLAQFGSLYQRCRQIRMNREAARHKENKGKNIGPCIGATVGQKHAEDVLVKICHKIMTPHTNDVTVRCVRPSNERE